MWLNRNTKQLVVGASPSDMADAHGGVFVGLDGNAKSNAEWIWQPDLSAVSVFPSKYWVISGDVVSLMDKASRDAVDLIESDAIKTSLVEAAALAVGGKALFNHENRVRALEGKAAVSVEQFKEALKALLE